MKLKQFIKAKKYTIISTVMTTLFCIVLIIFIPFVFDIKGDYLAYTGSIIGGGLTLLGVSLTISFQEAQRKEDLALQYKPILRIEKATDERERKIITKHENGKIYFNLLCYVKNVGRGEAAAIEFDHFQDNEDYGIINPHTMDIIATCNDFEKVSISGNEFGCLPVNSNNQLMIQLILNDKYINHDVFTFFLCISFKNAFSDTQILKHQAKIVIRNSAQLGIKSNEKYSLSIRNDFN